MTASEPSADDQRYSGRLELTWTNKHKRLLSHEDGSYEWLSPADYRVAEVRLLHEVRTVGEVGRVRAADNLLIRGDALNALTSLIRLPEFKKHYAGKVKLVYIDPPFNTQQSFLQYDDRLEHSVWLTMIRDRLQQAWELMSSDGTVWLHLDDSEVHRARSVMDEVFGPACFVGSIIWRSSDNSNNDAKQFSTDHNSILVYSRQVGWVSNRLPATLDQVGHYANPDDDPRGPWFDGNPVNSPNPRGNLRYTIISQTGYEIPPPPNGWRWSRETLDAKMATGEIRFSPDGESIKRRTYLKDHAGLPASSLWVDLDETGHNRQAKSELRNLFPGVPTSELFKTPKPERLLRRILTVASSPGDIVLDCFLGSGTTAAVAHKMGRRWVGIEYSAETISSYCLPRLQKVVAGQDDGGVSVVTTEKPFEELPEELAPEDLRNAAVVLQRARAAGLLEEPSTSENGIERLAKILKRLGKTRKVVESRWAGGGGFRIFDVAPSMFEAVDGMVYLADYLTNSALAEATAAQLGFEYEADPPFAGRKGRSRLAVIDGVVNEAVVRLLANALPEHERMVVCGTGIDPDARETLRALRPGSTMRKIPTALLESYREPTRLQKLAADVSRTPDGAVASEEPTSV